MNRLFTLLAACAACFSLASSHINAADVRTDDVITDPTSKQTFPAQVTFEDGGKSYTLDATGAATRNKLFIKVYSLAHYMENPPKGTGDAVFQEILSDGKAKQATMRWLYVVDAQKVENGFLESFRAAVPNPSNETKAAVDSFLKSYAQNVAVKDEYVIRWLPGNKIQLLINGQKKGEWVNADLAKGIWSPWFGPNSVLKKANLVSELAQ